MKTTFKTVILPLALASLVGADALAGSTVTVKPGSRDKDKVIVAPARKLVVERNEQGERVIDLTNAKHEQLVYQRVTRAGMTPEKFPQFFLNKEIQKQQQLMAKSFPLAESTTANSEAADEVIRNAHFFVDSNYGVALDNNKPYLIVRAKSSVFGGTGYTYADLLLEDSQGNQLAPMGSTYNMGEGRDTTVKSAVSLVSLKANYPELDMIYASSYVETEDAETGNIVSKLKYTQYPFNWDKLEAVYGSQFGSVSDLSTNVSTMAGDPRPVYTAVDPIDKNADAVIKVCLNRGHSDCDYGYDQSLPNAETWVQIPFKGQIVVGHKVTGVYASDVLAVGADEPTDIYLQEGVYGGATKPSYRNLDNSVKRFSDYITLGEPDDVTETTTISWNIPRAEGRFGNSLLFSNIAEANWYMNFSVKGYPNYITEGRGGRPAREQVFQLAVTSLNSDRFGNFYSETLPKMKLGYSCLAKGTEITMANGDVLSIEDIEAGDLVLGAAAKNASTAQPMTVVDVSIGIETIKMFRVKTKDGNNILMTETHPVSTSNKGIIWAKELVEGDRVLTATGSTLVTAITTEDYDDNIYNLKLAPLAGSSIEEGADLGMFANGLLVGDLAAQDEYNYKDQFSTETIEEKLQRIPERYKTDYLNSLSMN